MGLDDEYGFAPANYIEINDKAEQRSPTSAPSGYPAERGAKPAESSSPGPGPGARGGPAAAIAGIMHKQSPSSASHPADLSLPTRRPQYTPQESDEEEPAPSLPQRPPSQQLSPPPTQYASPRTPDSPGITASPPYNRAVSQGYDGGRPQNKAGGYHLYNINEMVSSALGKDRKVPTTLGLNLATGSILVAPEKSREYEWSAEKLTHYSIEGKHVFMELVRPSKSIDFHAGTKDTAQEIVAGLGEIAGAARAGGLREVLEAAGSVGEQKKGHVLYEFMAQGDDEVTVAVGDEVMVIDDSKSGEWWMIRRLKNGKEGVVPSSYVEITGTTAPPPGSTGIDAGRSVVEQNRLEEERLAKEAAKSSRSQGANDAKGSEVGPGMQLPTRGSSLITGNDGNHASQRSKRENKHGRTSSGSKSSECEATHD